MAAGSWVASGEAVAMTCQPCPSAGHQFWTSTTSTIFRDPKKAQYTTRFFILRVNLTSMNHNDCPSPRCSFSSRRTAELSKHKLTCRHYKAWNDKRVERGFRMIGRRRLAMQVCNGPSKMVARAHYWQASNVLYKYRRLLMFCIWTRVLST